MIEYYIKTYTKRGVLKTISTHETIEEAHAVYRSMSSHDKMTHFIQYSQDACKVFESAPILDKHNPPIYNKGL